MHVQIVLTYIPLFNSLHNLHGVLIAAAAACVMKQIPWGLLIYLRRHVQPLEPTDQAALPNDTLFYYPSGQNVDKYAIMLTLKCLVSK